MCMEFLRSGAAGRIKVVWGIQAGGYSPALNHNEVYDDLASA